MLCNYRGSDSQLSCTTIEPHNRPRGTGGSSVKSSVHWNQLCGYHDIYIVGSVVMRSCCITIYTINRKLDKLAFQPVALASLLLIQMCVGISVCCWFFFVETIINRYMYVLRTNRYS